MSEPVTAEKKPGHTPGPWTIRPVGSMDFRRPGEDANDLCLVAENGICPGIVWDYLKEGEANARLIAAAPDLLEALVACVEHMEWSTENGAMAYRRAKELIEEANGNG